MVCVDTDFMVDLDRGRPKAFDKLQQLEAAGEAVFITAITVAELYNGAHRSKNREQALADVSDALSRFQVLGLDYESAKIWGELASQLKSNSIGDLDLFIASIAIANRQALITRNARHFERVPGLQVQDW